MKEKCSEQRSVERGRQLFYGRMSRLPPDSPGKHPQSNDAGNPLQ